MSPQDDAPLAAREIEILTYVDDAMDADARRRFERAMADDPDLAAEVAAQRVAADLASNAEVPEPTDAEMARFWTSYYNRSEWSLGWVLLVVGGVVVVGDGIYWLVTTNALDPWVKAGALMALAGATILLWSTFRQKVRSHRLDRYRGVIQ